MSETEGGETEDSAQGSPPTEGEIPCSKLLQLNLRRLTTVQLKKIAEGRELPSFRDRLDEICLSIDFLAVLSFTRGVLFGACAITTLHHTYYIIFEFNSND